MRWNDGSNSRREENDTAKKKGRPIWFKMFLHHKALVDSVPDETAGLALKALLRYFAAERNEDAPDIMAFKQTLDPLAFAVFVAIKPYIDEAFEDFEQTRAKNRANAMKRWNKDPVPLDANDASGSQWMPVDAKHAEEEVEEEVEVEVEEEGVAPPAAPPAPTTRKKRFIPPTLAEVQSYVAERHSPVDPQEFIDFYESKGWMVGKTPMKDWKAACRNAEHWERWQKNRNRAYTESDYDSEDGDFLSTL